MRARDHGKTAHKSAEDGFGYIVRRFDVMFLERVQKYTDLLELVGFSGYGIEDATLVFFEFLLSLGDFC